MSKIKRSNVIKEWIFNDEIEKKKSQLKLKLLPKKLYCRNGISAIKQRKKLLKKRTLISKFKLLIIFLVHQQLFVYT
ncbi:MAG: hypothetical protein FWC47_14180 [Oscillospiraceae bacterium]|nr:hypothetical protein [Oscillospiraceae bacterium]